MTEAAPLINASNNEPTSAAAASAVVVGTPTTAAALRYTPLQEIPVIVAQMRQRAAKRRVEPRADNISARKNRLRRLGALIGENKKALCDALYADFRKPSFEAFLSEIDFSETEIYHTLDHLDAWLAPRDAVRQGIQRFDAAQILREPRGCVLLIVPANYPVSLLLSPLIGLWAAGNTVVVKPSETCTNVAVTLTALIERYFDKNTDDIAVVNGGIAETSALLTEKFDHIVFTGSTRIGSVVAMAAAKHLTSVTLELGGKSPAVVDVSCDDLSIIAKRIMWGKCLNSGQTCIAPDYVLIHPSKKAKFVEACRAALAGFYGSAGGARASPDYTRMICDSYFKRVKGLLDGSIAAGSKVVLGGATDAETRFIEPTLIDVAAPSKDPTMAEEIFGPLLPLVDCNSVDDAIRFINARDKPLALYVFAEDSAAVEKLLTSTTSGGVTVNDCLMHITVPGLPFGGVNSSGIGAYHGERGIVEFSHERSVLYKKKSLDEGANDMTRYPPYTDSATRPSCRASISPSSRPNSATATGQRSARCAVSRGTAISAPRTQPSGSSCFSLHCHASVCSRRAAASSTSRLCRC